MIVLALDPSSKAIGWAVSDPVPGLRIGAWRPLGWRDAGMQTDQRHREMCGRASHWLSDMITEHGPSVIVLEVGGGRQSDRCSERLRGALLAVAWCREIATVTVHPATWQAWARRDVPGYLFDWKAAGKPDDQAARMILDWWLETGTMEGDAA